LNCLVKKNSQGARQTPIVISSFGNTLEESKTMPLVPKSKSSHVLQPDLCSEIKEEEIEQSASSMIYNHPEEGSSRRQSSKKKDFQQKSKLISNSFKVQEKEEIKEMNEDVDKMNSTKINFLCPQALKPKKSRNEKISDHANSNDDSGIGNYSDVSILYHYDKSKNLDKTSKFSSPEKRKLWQSKYNFKLNPKYHNAELLKNDKVVEEVADKYGYVKRIYTSGRKEKIFPRLK